MGSPQGGRLLDVDDSVRAWSTCSRRFAGKIGETEGRRPFIQRSGLGNGTR